MIRTLIWTPILFVVGVLAALYVAYGHADPCRALAVEQTRRSLAPAVIAEPLARMQTSQMSSTACASRLLRSWRDRIVIGAL